jgi:hypothetical protein
MQTTHPRRVRRAALLAVSAVSVATAALGELRRDRRPVVARTALAVVQ